MSKDWRTNLELLDQRNEDQRWRDEAAVKLAVRPGQREALERARAKLNAERLTLLQRGARLLGLK
ncbi:hypothetical protein AXL1_76 [Stenotrophomonas phage vB_SmaS-AXL_1]|uniref:hypothetical protein n=1 Tax=Stenotrophomonas phage vB_SmaS-AXL_1 TaxID=2909581 RepID=UPI0024097C03|nr:hypothetical protein P9A52_gp76 [Stenotrophomonas phage vB_SmaS-AXL_1]UIS24800.1 hypothetical protein AXL1_76 [Stenotrophomonas phage vB_SmaS-AXL_1]